MYKVFLQNKALIFTQSVNSQDSDVLIYSLSEVLSDKAYFIKNFEADNNTSSAYVVCDDPMNGMQDVFADYHQIEAAGGLVENKEHFLFIKRLGYWDIPKGKMEKDENPSETAVREVEEECGISAPKIIDFIGCTYHTYFFKEKNVLKKTYWYSMSYEGDLKLTPQLEEDITEAVWLKRSDLKLVYENTYPSILDVLKSVFPDEKDQK